MTKSINPPPPPEIRIASLDGLRGIAVLMVVLYHYFQRFPEFTPYEDQLLPWTSYGYLGVHLFFMISGFVIAFTLERGKPPLDFVIRRFLRLWPPILVCSIFTFTVMYLVDSPFTVARRVDVSGFLPSLTFIQPSIWAKILPVDNYIDGAYWSLFVEVRFYFWALMLSFLVGMRKFAIIAFAATSLLVVAWHSLEQPAIRFQLDMLFFVSYLPLFTIGILAYEAMVRRHFLLIVPCIVLTWCFEISMLSDAVEIVAITLFCMLFIGLAVRPTSMDWLSSSPLVGLGVISYALYLLHQNIGVTFIGLLPRGLSDMTYFFLVFGILSFIIVMSWLVFLLVEKPSQGIARRLTAVWL